MQTGGNTMKEFEIFAINHMQYEIVSINAKNEEEAKEKYKEMLEKGELMLKNSWLEYDTIQVIKMRRK